MLSVSKQLVFWLLYIDFSLILYFFLLVILVLLVLNFRLMFAQKPLFSWYLYLSFFLIFLLLSSMLCVKLFFPSVEILHRDRSEGCKFRSFKNFFYFSYLCFFSLVGSAFDQVLMNPVSCFLYDIENDRFLLAILNNLINDFDDMIDVISGKPCNWLDFIVERSGWIFFGKLKHDVDLIFQLISFVWFTQDIEFVGCSLLHYLELI